MFGIVFCPQVTLQKLGKPKTSPARVARKVPEVHAIVPGLVFGSLLQLRNLIPVDGGTEVS